MEKSFTFDSFYKNEALSTELTIYIDIWCHDDDGDYGYDDLAVYDGSTEIKFESLPTDEQHKIELKADHLAYVCSPEAYQDYCEGRADMLYDKWKDSQYDD